MSPNQLRILQHSLGCDKFGIGSQYRNHYAIGPGCDGFFDCRDLAENGLMIDHGPQAAMGGIHCFTVTPEGKKAMSENSPKPIKLTRGQIRYREYLSSEFGMNFGEWLKWKFGKGRNAI